MKLLVTDLDGTLARSDSSFSELTKATLQQAGEREVVRVVATGRSLHSARNMIALDFPIDYLIFSCGAGVVEWKTQEIILANKLLQKDVTRIGDHLSLGNYDFMMHGLIPENHYFYYFGTGISNPDFISRCGKYLGLGAKAEWPEVPKAEATQFLVVEPPARGRQTYARLVSAFPEYSVILTTSPLDHVSFWIEIFPKHVNKGLTSEWLKARLGISSDHTFAVGNDYNDLDLLRWARHAYVVGNSPETLRSEFRAVKPNNEEGFSQAVEHWLSSV